MPDTPLLQPRLLPNGQPNAERMTAPSAPPSTVLFVDSSFVFVFPDNFLISASEQRQALQNLQKFT